MCTSTNPVQSRITRSRTRRLAAVPAAVLAASAIAALGAPATAEATQCAAREAMIDRLSNKYDEHPVSIGVTATGSLLEVLASSEGTWTIIVTVPGGPTCLVSSGDGWQNSPASARVAEGPHV